MAFGIGDDLSVKISANTRDLERGISSARETLGDLATRAVETAGALQILSSEADDAGDEMSQAGRKGTAASGGVTAFGGASAGASFGVRSLSSSLMIGLVPALTIVAAAITPLIPALLGFAAIAGSIAGVGLVGVLAGIATEGDRLKTTFKSVVGTLKDAFAPVGREAAEVLTTLMLRFEDIIPQLVPAEDTLTKLSGLFAELGASIIENIPAFTKLATSLATEFLPPFVEFVHNTLPRVPGMIRGAVDWFRRLAPMFRDAGQALSSLIPDLLDFGMTALDVVAPAVGDIVSAIEGGLEYFNQLDSQFKGLGMRAALLAAPLSTLVSLLGGPAGIGVLGAVIALKRGWETNFADIRTTLKSAFSAIKRVLGNRLPTLISELKELWRTLRPVVEPILDAVIQLLATGVVNALDAVLSGVTALVQVLNGDFAGAWETVSGFIERYLSRVGEFLNQITGGAFEQTVNSFIKGINKMGAAAEDFLEMAGLGGQFDFKKIEQVELGTTPLTPNNPQQQQQSSPGERSDQRVVVELKDDMLRAEARDQAEVVVESRERRASRNTGGNPTPR